METDHDNFLVETLDFKSPKCDYVYPESSVIEHSSEGRLSILGFSVSITPNIFCLNLPVLILLLCSFPLSLYVRLKQSSPVISRLCMKRKIVSI